MAKLKVLLVAAEAAPFAVHGDLAQVAGSLPQALRDLDIDVRVFLPWYKSVADCNIAEFHDVGTVSFQTAFGEERALVRGTVLHGVPFYFVVNDELYQRDGLYSYRGADGNWQDYDDNLHRFAFFSRAALESMSVTGFIPDVVHGYAWHSALVPVYLKTLYRFRDGYGKMRTLLTMPNMAFQGLFPRDQYPITGLPYELFSAENLEYYGMINLLKGGVLFADQLNTVSGTYAKEIQTERFGCGLEGVLRRRKDDLSGILDGIDHRAWNPDKDPHTYGITYGHHSLARKAEIKRRLLEELGLDAGDTRRPLVVFTSRLEAQKGLALLEDLKDTLLGEDLSMVVLAAGSHRYAELFRRMAELSPGRFAFSESADDERLLHRVLAAGDILLMPSEYEPCGLYQLLALRYGTVPLVHHTGGLADTVVDEHNGFSFHEYTSRELLATVRRALAAYRDRDRWQKLQKQGMKEDWSWSSSAKEYRALYKALAASD